MPKKQAPNGFMVFTHEWKAKHGRNINLREATDAAGKIWKNMNASERGPYNERAKSNKIAARDDGKLACTGVPVKILEKERDEKEKYGRQIKRDIENTVRNSVNENQLEDKKFFFIMVNYFTKTFNGGIYVPAEISVAEFSLRDGVSRKYHTYVNPGVNIYGHQYEAQQHSDTTHMLPLPPRAMGETNLGGIYNDIVEFIRDKETGELPPLYTLKDSIPIVESALNFLKADLSAKHVDLTLYFIQYLFFIMKDAAAELGDAEKPKSVFITDAYFERDFFEYQVGIACQFHESVDKSKYCTQSCVTRWGYMFAEYICPDLAIPLMKGRHVPEETDMNAIVNSRESSRYEMRSVASVTSTVTSKPSSNFKNRWENDNFSTNTSAYETANEFKERNELPHLGAKSAGTSVKEYKDMKDFPLLGSKPRKKTASPSNSPTSVSSSKYARDVFQDRSRSDYRQPTNPWDRISSNASDTTVIPESDEADYTTSTTYASVSNNVPERLGSNQSNIRRGIGRGQMFNDY